MDTRTLFKVTRDENKVFVGGKGKQCHVGRVRQGVDDVDVVVIIIVVVVIYR
jgi:hypothetical protein